MHRLPITRADGSRYTVARELARDADLGALAEDVEHMLASAPPGAMAAFADQLANIRKSLAGMAIALAEHYPWPDPDAEDEPCERLPDTDWDSFRAEALAVLKEVPGGV